MGAAPPRSRGAPQGTRAGGARGPLLGVRSGVGTLLILASAAAAPAKPGTSTAGDRALDRAARDSIVAQIEAERAKTDEWLRSGPTSYLAAVGRVDFGGRLSLTVGRAAGNDLRLDHPDIARNHLRVTVVGDSFRVEALDPGARFTSADAERREATLPPSSIGLGPLLLRLSHQRLPALIVFDPQSPNPRKFQGLRYFPVDLSYRFAVPLKPAARPDTMVILSTRGNARRALRAGWFEFRAGGRRCRLEATRLLEPGVGENDLALFFQDQTSGKETYPLGRYLDPEPLPDGRYLLDFNRAYTPACAFSDHYNCPIPPRGNRLGVAIRAGEMDPRYGEP